MTYKTQYNEAPYDTTMPYKTFSQPLNSVQKRLHFTWGALVSFAVVVVAMSQPTNASFPWPIWLVLFIWPAVMAFSLLKMPKWQSVPLSSRKPLIFSALGLSWLAVAVAPLIMLARNQTIPEGITVFLLVLGTVYGALAMRLEWQSAHEPDEMFP